MDTLSLAVLIGHVRVVAIGVEPNQGARKVSVTVRSSWLSEVKNVKLRGIPMWSTVLHLDCKDPASSCAL